MNIVTDGGSAFCKMFKEFGSAVDTTTFDDEEITEQHFELESNSNDSLDVGQPFMEDINGELFASEILTFGEGSTVGHSNIISEPNEDFDNYLNGFDDIQQEPQIELPKQRRCISHHLNLLSKDFYNELTGLAKASFVAALNKLHSLWVLTHKSSQSKTICICCRWAHMTRNSK